MNWIKYGRYLRSRVITQAAGLLSYFHVLVCRWKYLLEAVVGAE